MTDSPLLGVRVVFRCDGSPSIGFGHVARCLVLAGEMRNMGVRGTRFVTRNLDSGVIRRIESAGHECTILTSTIGDMADRDATMSVCGEEPSCLVTDSHDLSERYYADLHSASIPILSFDDYAGVTYASDVVVNHNVGADRLGYRSSPHTRFLLGPEYVPLGDRFRSLAGGARLFRERVKSVVVTLGGMPEPEVTSRVLDGLRPWATANHARVTMVLGIQASTEMVHRLKELVPPLGSVVVDPPGLAGLLWEADLAVVNGSLTAYEAASLGVPLIMTAMADNQAAAVAGFAEAGAAMVLPPARELVSSAVASTVEATADDVDLRTELGSVAKTLVDGRGAERIIRAAACLVSGATDERKQEGFS